MVSFAASADDNCPGVSVACAPPSGSTFAKGVTSVLCTARDSSGNTKRCSFQVTVSDNEKPIITCPAIIVKNADSGRCDTAVIYAVNATDNCGEVTVSCSPVSGSSFAKGVTTVSCIARDSSGNSASCSFAVQVNDSEVPQITCPGNLVFDNEPGRCGAVAVFSPVGRDNCSDIAVSCTPPTGSFFSIGLTTVHCAASDAASNRAECAFSIAVRDTEKPQIVCPGDIIVPDVPGSCSS